MLIKKVLEQITDISNSFLVTLLQDGDENMKFTGDTGIYKIEIDATKNIQSLNITASPVLGYDFS